MSWPGNTSLPSSSSTRWIPSAGHGMKMRARLREGSKRSSWSRCRVCAGAMSLLGRLPPKANPELHSVAALARQRHRAISASLMWACIKERAEAFTVSALHHSQSMWCYRALPRKAPRHGLVPMGPGCLCRHLQLLVSFSTGVGNNNDGTLVLGATNIPWVLDSAIRRR